MKHIVLIFLLIIFTASAVHSQTKRLDSAYTSLARKACKKLQPDVEDGILYKADCRGVGGYRLIFLESEHAQSLDVVAPTGEEHQLDLPQKVSAAPSYLGPRAEWRVHRRAKGLRPIALILRINVFENPDKSDATTSYLMIAKIGKTVCITDIVKPARDQNRRARELADAAENKICMAADY